MGWQEAEKYITHLVNTYDKNKDGKFDYSGTGEGARHGNRGWVGGRGAMEQGEGGKQGGR